MPGVLNLSSMAIANADLLAPVVTVMRRDPVTLPADITVEAAIQYMRRVGAAAERVVYFYVVDAEQRLVGVLPVRRLLMAAPDRLLSEIMESRVVSLPDTATVLDACELFLMHRFLALPVVDAGRRIIGVVDITVLSEEAFDIAERAQTDALFESIGLRIYELRTAAASRAVVLRFPWLTATMVSGLCCAVLAGAFAHVLTGSIALSFFLTLILGLGESVCAQSMAIAVQALRARRPTWDWYMHALGREAVSGVGLGCLCACAAVLVARVWLGAGSVAVVLGLAIPLAVATGCVVGLSVPTALHALRLDPKVASGPVALAVADVCTVAIYFSIASVVI